MSSTKMVAGFLMQDSWTALYDLALNDAEELAELADEGHPEPLLDLMGWVVPMLGAASGDPELRAREEALRERTGVHCDESLRVFVESVAVEIPEAEG